MREDVCFVNSLNDNEPADAGSEGSCRVPAVRAPALRAGNPTQIPLFRQQVNCNTTLLRLTCQPRDVAHVQNSPQEEASDKTYDECHAWFPGFVNKSTLLPVEPQPSSLATSSSIM